MALLCATLLLPEGNPLYMEALSSLSLPRIDHRGFSASNAGHCFIGLKKQNKTIQKTRQGCISVVAPRFLLCFSNWMFLVLHKVLEGSGDASVSSHGSQTAEVDVHTHTAKSSPRTFLQEAYSRISKPGGVSFPPSVGDSGISFILCCSGALQTTVKWGSWQL